VIFIIREAGEFLYAEHRRAGKRSVESIGTVKVCM
jgi:hypothetical protein